MRVKGENNRNIRFINCYNDKSNSKATDKNNISSNTNKKLIMIKNNIIKCSNYNSSSSCTSNSHSVKPTFTWWGSLSNKKVSTSAAIREARRSDTTNFDQTSRPNFFMLMRRTWFKLEEFKLEKPPYLQYILAACWLWIKVGLYSISNIYSFKFAWRHSSYIIFSLVHGVRKFCFWRWNMISSETDMRELCRII